MVTFVISVHTYVGSFLFLLVKLLPFPAASERCTWLRHDRSGHPTPCTNWLMETKYHLSLRGLLTASPKTHQQEISHWMADAKYETPTTVLYLSEPQLSYPSSQLNSGTSYLELVQIVAHRWSSTHPSPTSLPNFRCHLQLEPPYNDWL